MFASKFLLIAALAFVASASLLPSPIKTDEPFVRLTSGRPSVPGQFPYHVSLFIRSGNRWVLSGAGALVGGGRRVVTLASNVLLGNRDIFAILGSDFKRGPRSRVNGVIVHPRYRETRSMAFDIAVFDFQYQREFPRTIRPVALVSANADVQKEGGIVHITGFGSAGRPNRSLHWAIMHVTTQQICRESFRRLESPAVLCVSNPQGNGIGTGDAGAPIVWWPQGNVQLVGLALRTNGTVNAFLNIANYAEWLRKLV